MRVLYLPIVIAEISIKSDLYKEDYLSEDYSSSYSSTWYNVQNVDDNYMRGFSKPQSPTCISDTLYDYHNFDAFFIQQNEQVVVGKFVEKNPTTFTIKKCRILKHSTDSDLHKPCDTQRFGIEDLETNCGSIDTYLKDKWVILAVKFNFTKQIYELDAKPLVVKSYWKILKKSKRMGINYPQGIGFRMGNNHFF